MVDLQIGHWTMPSVPVDRAVCDICAITRTSLSDAYIAERPPIIEYLDPARRGLIDILLRSQKVNVDDTNILFFSNAQLFAGRLIVSSDNKLYSDQRLTEPLLDQLIAGGGDIKIHEHKLHKTDKGYGTDALMDEPQELDDVNILLTSSEPINYGAWLIRVFPKIYNLQKAGLLETGKFLCFVDRPWQERLLEWVGIPLSHIRRQSLTSHYKLEKLIVPTWPSRNKFLDNATQEFIQKTQKRVGQVHQALSPGKPVYVSRLNWNRELDAKIAKNPQALRMRPFDQEWELSSRLELLGFEIFSPENHSFEEVLSRFVNAPLVVGPQGAGLFNAIFCLRGTPVIEIVHLPYFIQGHANMFLSCGLNYMVVVGEDPELGFNGSHPVHRMLKIDVDATELFIKKQLDKIKR